MTVGGLNRTRCNAQALIYPGIDGCEWDPERADEEGNAAESCFFNLDRPKFPKKAPTLLYGQEHIFGGSGFAAPPTFLVGSTSDTSTPLEEHTDRYAAALKAARVAVAVTFTSP